MRKQMQTKQNSQNILRGLMVVQLGEGGVPQDVF